MDYLLPNAASQIKLEVESSICFLNGAMTRINENKFQQDHDGDLSREMECMLDELQRLSNALDMRCFSKYADPFFICGKGSLTAYEMRIGKTKPTQKEAAFKAHKKNKQVAQSNEEDSNDELTANFVQKLRKGKGKFKGKLPFKCFNCGGISHFAAKCPLANTDEDDSDSYKSKKDYSSLKDEKEEEKPDNEEIEIEINLEEELIAALEQLSTKRKKNKKISKKMAETEEIVETLKVEIEEGRKIKEELESQVIIKTKECSRMKRKLQV
ncbi:hypothetical protein MRB53_022689 [Persea americana]|uniref:Uncharacterized protein n=1 Tax=Persea americana TaxID=3435 RepID=A0ACC2L764_PERAE|nr:hypothetical protein MRB53_022689 [Persea americana]